MIEPAFPCNSPDGAGAYSGIVVRDYFAARAMQALLITDGTSLPSYSGIARIAYEMADAMLKAREEKTWQT